MDLLALIVSGALSISISKLNNYSERNTNILKEKPSGKLAQKQSVLYMSNNIEKQQKPINLLVLKLFIHVIIIG
jgi:hypothetical protein